MFLTSVETDRDFDWNFDYVYNEDSFGPLSDMVLLAFSLHNIIVLLAVNNL